MASLTALDSPGYINVRSSPQTGLMEVNMKEAPPAKKVQRYINMSFHESGGAQNGVTSNGHSGSDGSGSGNQVEDPNPASPASASVPATASAGDQGTTASEEHPTLRRHNSEVSWENKASLSPRTRSPAGGGWVSSEGGVTEAKMKLLMPATTAAGRGSSNSSAGCENCDELNKLLAMWEIGVSGLTRNYSRILAHLMKVRNSSMALEFRLTHGADSGCDSPPHKTTASSNASPSHDVVRENTSVLPPSMRVPKNRQSMFVKNGSSIANNVREQDLAENMYPTRQETTSPKPKVSVESQLALPLCARDLNDLNSHLGEAIDLCQQLAAACFKTNHLSDFTGVRSSSHSSPLKKYESAGNVATRKHSADALPNHSPFKPSLNSIAESKVSSEGPKRKRTLERVPSAPNLEFSGDFGSSSDSHESESGFVTVRKADIPDSVRKADTTTTTTTTTQDTRKGGTPPSNRNASPKDTTKESAVKPKLSASEQSKEESNATSSSFSPTGEFLMSVERDSGLDYRPESFISTVSTYSDNDVKYIMSKIATLEDERYKLLDTIDTLQEDNNTVSLVKIAL